MQLIRKNRRYSLKCPVHSAEQSIDVQECLSAERATFSALGTFRRQRSAAARLRPVAERVWGFLRPADDLAERKCVVYNHLWMFMTRLRQEEDTFWRQYYRRKYIRASFIDINIYTVWECECRFVIKKNIAPNTALNMSRDLMFINYETICL